MMFNVEIFFTDILLNANSGAIINSIGAKTTFLPNYATRLWDQAGGFMAAECDRAW